MEWLYVAINNAEKNGVYLNTIIYLDIIWFFFLTYKNIKKKVLFCCSSSEEITVCQILNLNNWEQFFMCVCSSLLYAGKLPAHKKKDPCYLGQSFFHILWTKTNKAKIVCIFSFRYFHSCLWFLFIY